MEDCRIIELFFERSEEAVTELSKKYEKQFRRIAMNILDNERDAEECVNDTLLAVWNAIPPEHPRSLPGFACRIARNIAAKRYQSIHATKRNNRFDVSFEELAETISCASTPNDGLDVKITADEIGIFLKKLKKSDRIMFVRRYFMLDSLSDIAFLFNVSEHYVSVRLSRTKAALKKHLLEKGISI